MEVDDLVCKSNLLPASITMPEAKEYLCSGFKFSQLEMSKSSSLLRVAISLHWLIMTICCFEQRS